MSTPDFASASKISRYRLALRFDRYWSYPVGRLVSDPGVWASNEDSDWVASAWVSLRRDERESLDRPPNVVSPLSGLVNIILARQKTAYRRRH